MALEALTNVSNALATLFDAMVQRQMCRKAVLLGLLVKKPGGGKNCAWDVEFSGAAADTFTEGADVAAGDLAQDVKVPATLDWGFYRSNFGVSGLAKAVAASSNTSPEALRALIEDDILGSASKLASVINAKLYNGSGAGHIIGLDSALAATGTYANISKATYTEWAGNIETNSGTDRALTKSLLDKLETAIYEDCGESPDIIVATPAVVRKYESLFDAITQVVLPQGELSAGTRAPNLGAVPQNSTGFSGFTYKGIPVFRDKDATAGTLRMLNSDYVEVKTVPPAHRRATQTQASTTGLTDEQGRSVGLNVDFQPLAKTGDSDRFSLVTYIQMKVKKVNAHGIIEDIDET